MPAPSSLTARQAVGLQTAKGTFATTFTAGVLRRSTLSPRFNYMEPIAEHFGGTNTRATMRKSASDRPTFLMQWGGRQRLKPNFLGYLLRGAGFGSNVTGAAPALTHAFTIANRENAAWLSVMQQMGEGAGVIERKARDCRVSSITVNATREDIDLTYDGLGLSEIESTGTETTTVEPQVNILPSTGSMSIQIASVAVTTKIMASTLTIANPLSEDEVALHSAAYDDLPPTALDISGTLSGIDFTEDVYKKLNWGGVAGLSPATATPVGVLTYTFESGSVIPTGSVPYALTVSVPVAELRMSEPVAEDDNLIRVDINWSMLDTTATPITITLVNGKTNYTS
jgi:hypothetical protein